MTLAWLSDPLQLLVLALATFRVTRLLVDDAVWPLPALRAKVHAWAADRQAARCAAAADPEAAWVAAARRGPTGVALLITCYWCTGFWVSVLAALAASLLPAPVWLLPAAVLALSAVTGLLARLTD